MRCNLARVKVFNMTERNQNVAKKYARRDSSERESDNPYAGLSDAELIVRARQDRAAFGELYERYVDRIYAYFYYRTGRHEDAEELTSRFFQRILERLHLYEDRGVPVAAWLYRIAHNMLANWRRDNARRVEVPLDGLRNRRQPQIRPDEEVVHREAVESLWEAIRELPPERQMLLYLKFYEGRSNAEIGEILGRTEGAIKSLYHRTLLSLRQKLRRRGLIEGREGEETEAGKEELA